MTDSLVSYAWVWPLPFVTIMYASGQWFQTEIWERYHRGKLASAPPLTRVMMDYREGAAPWTFFNHNRGETWTGWDKYAFDWIGDHIATTIVVAVVLGASVICAAMFAWRFVRPLMGGYAKLPRHESAA